MKRPEITLIIPVYNTEKYLTECLNSIVNQTFRDIEIICINDCSADNSLEVLNSFARQDNRILVVNTEKPSGSAGLPRNIGIEKAKGKYLMFLDSDDYFDLEMLEKLYNHAEKTNSDLVMCDNYRIMPETFEKNIKNTELHHEYIPDLRVFSYKDIPNEIFQISNAAVWHKLILTEVVKKHGLKFQTNSPSLDDVYFVNSILVLAERISILDERLIYYRVVREGAQTTTIGKYKESILYAFEALNVYLTEIGVYDEVKVSLQNWTMNMMKWWIDSVTDYDLYCELFELYRNSYLEKLGLENLELSDLRWDLDKFYVDLQNNKKKLNMGLKDDSNIAIYGAGNLGLTLHNYIKNQKKYNISLWCDKNAETIGKPEIKHPIELINSKYDAIIIAIYDDNIVEEVKKYLLNFGVDLSCVYKSNDIII